MFKREGALSDDPLTRAIIAAWNTMNGEIDWSALPFLAEFYGVDDVEMWVQGLLILRAEMRPAE